MFCNAARMDMWLLMTGKLPVRQRITLWGIKNSKAHRILSEDGKTVLRARTGRLMLRDCDGK